MEAGVHGNTADQGLGIEKEEKNGETALDKRRLILEIHKHPKDNGAGF